MLTCDRRDSAKAKAMAPSCFAASRHSRMASGTRRSHLRATAYATGKQARGYILSSAARASGIEQRPTADRHAPSVTSFWADTHTCIGRGEGTHRAVVLPYDLAIHERDEALVHTRLVEVGRLHKLEDWTAVSTTARPVEQRGRAGR